MPFSIKRQGIIRERVKKIAFLAGHPAKEGGAKKCIFFKRDVLKLKTVPLTSKRGGGVKTLAEYPAKNAIFAWLAPRTFGHCTLIIL